MTLLAIEQKARANEQLQATLAMSLGSADAQEAQQTLARAN